jgi:hypothetical protein
MTTLIILVGLSVLGSVISIFLAAAGGKKAPSARENFELIKPPRKGK